MRKVNPKNLFIVLRSDKDSVHRVSEMYINDEMSVGNFQRTIYKLDNGNEVPSSECFTTNIPSLYEFNKVLSKYPKAIEDRNSCEADDYVYNQDIICSTYKDITMKSLIKEMNYHRQKIADIENQLGILR